MFDVTIWGTVGQWASSLLTGSAFATTLLVIKRESVGRRREQASLVSAHAEPSSPDMDPASGKPCHIFRIYVNNHSSSSIHTVHGGPETVSYRRYRHQFMRLRAEYGDDQRKRLAPEYTRSEWKRENGPDAIEATSFTQEPTRGQHVTLVPQDGITFVHRGHLSAPFLSLAVYFNDARGRKWRLDALTGELREVRKPRRGSPVTRYRIWRLQVADAATVVRSRTSAALHRPKKPRQKAQEEPVAVDDEQ
ncbi:MULTISPECIES: hypothetical protein [unclassified Mycobacterium]|uniref:hypothetical protein n=1 Tax=unclassified Mycobacterium TaxID=2642494 RepID=UPI001115CFCC|nr:MULTISPECIES: hypothetical protein [unclassified Mycobacterium]